MTRENSPQWGRRRSQTAHLGSYSPVAVVVVLAAAQLAWQGLLVAHAQYSGTVCDTGRLLRCQQDIIRDVQVGGLKAASSQYNMGGPPYSPKHMQQLYGGTQITCRLVRSNLDCLLSVTPACYDQGMQAARNTDVILRAKRFLEQNGCNEPDTTWQTSYCYRTSEIKACEDRYSFSNPEFATISLDNMTACLSYQAFKHCVDTYSRFTCKVHEIDMMNEYLIDRASDLAWRCPSNSTNLSNYQLSNHNPSGTILSPYSSFSVYDQRQLPIPTYVGSHSANLGGGGGGYGGAGIRDQAWERFRNPVEDPRYAQGISRYPNYGGSGEVLGNGFEVESSECAIKAAPYARECERTLESAKHSASDSRDGNELQRRLCCYLYQYRDCLSRIVVDRCTAATPSAVELLMGVRKQEMSFTCNRLDTNICSGSVARSLMNLPLVMAVAIVSIIVIAS